MVPRLGALLLAGFCGAAAATYLYDLVLVDANTDQNVTHSASMFEPMVIDLAEFPSNASFSISAEVQGEVDFVNFTLYFGTTYDFASTLIHQPTKTLTFIDTPPPPFTLGGKTLSGHYKPVPALVTPGNYALHAIASSKNDTDEFFKNIQVLAPARVANYTLVDTRQGTDIATVFQYTNIVDTLYAANGYMTPFKVDSLLFSKNATLSIRANTVGQVGSVEFKLVYYNSTSHSNVTLLTTLSNKRPFALGGLTSGGKFKAVPALQVPGSYTLQVTAYHGPSKRGGPAGPRQWIDFVMLPRFRVVTFRLVNVNTSKAAQFNAAYIRPIISLCSFLPKTALDIRADIGSPAAGSVEFELSFANGTLVLTHVDNTPPFSLGQPSNGSLYGGVPALQQVTNTRNYLLRATPYTRSNKRGTKGTPLEFSFVVFKCLI